MKPDLTKLAEQMRRAHARGQSMRLPAMTFRELGILSRLLETPPASTSVLVH